MWRDARQDACGTRTAADVQEQTEFPSAFLMPHDLAVDVAPETSLFHGYIIPLRRPFANLFAFCL